jgi:hypothetical protein
MRPLLAFAAIVLLALPALAADTGKEGLWTVNMVWQFTPPVVPSVWTALARQQGLRPPVNGQPFTYHMCMTRYEADGSQPLHFNSRDYDCINRVVSFRRSVMVMESICHGQVEGVGHYQISWRGNTHFEGNYSFAGKFRGEPARMSSAISGDWAGADCRGVRIYIPQNP